MDFENKIIKRLNTRVDISKKWEQKRQWQHSAVETMILLGTRIGEWFLPTLKYCCLRLEVIELSRKRKLLLILLEICHRLKLITVQQQIITNRYRHPFSSRKKANFRRKELTVDGKMKSTKHVKILINLFVSTSLEIQNEFEFFNWTIRCVLCSTVILFARNMRRHVATNENCGTTIWLLPD